MRAERHRRARRLPAVVAVLVALALAGVANATMRPRPGVHDGGRDAGGPAEQAVATTSRWVSSSAWYCAGPLPLGKGRQASSVAVANLGDRPARGQLVVSSSTGNRSVTAIAVAPHAQAVYGLARAGRAARGAATVLVDTAGVGVEELVDGPDGPMAAPCTVSTAQTQYLAVGSTRGADDVSLAVYDPGATPAVVSISFATTTGGAAPPAFQGVDVAPGHVAVLDVGHQVSSRPAVATIVSSTGGRVVVGALVQSSVGSRVLAALVGAAPWAARRWELPAAPLGTSARQSFSVLNPTDRPAHVVVRLAGAAGGEIGEAVPPGAVVAVGPAAARAVGATGATVRSTGAPVVVAQELALTASPATAVKRPGGRHAVAPATRLAGLPAGFSAASGTTAPYRRWLLAGGECDARVGELVTVSNPGTDPARVRLLDLAGSPAASAGSSVVVPPGGSVAISAGALGLRGELPLVVSSTTPVVAGQLLYATGRGGVGLTAGAGIPID